MLNKAAYVAESKKLHKNGPACCFSDVVVGAIGGDGTRIFNREEIVFSPYLFTVLLFCNTIVSLLVHSDYTKLYNPERNATCNVASCIGSGSHPLRCVVHPLSRN